MSEPNHYLSELYGTFKTAQDETQDEDMSKQAQAELFVKLAAEQGVDLDALSKEQVGSLWESVFGEKLAADEEEKKDEEKDEKKDGAPPPFMKKEDGEEEKKAQAEAEFAQKKAAQEEFAQKHAEADYLGRVMAHSLHDELKKIAAKTEGLEKEAKGGGLMQAAKKAPEAARAFGAAAKEHVGKHKGKYLAGAASGAAGAAGYAAGRSKKASALDELATKHAIKLASDGGFNDEEAAERIGAVAILGLKESEKIASADTTDQAVEIRALEYLEAAGYPVTWSDASAE